VLAEVHELALKVDENLAADIAPAATKRIILGKIAPRTRIDHAIKEASVKVALWIARRAVRQVIELGIFFYHQLEHVSLDHHEPVRRLSNLDEPSASA
jgi:hypothetical protein